MHKQTIQTSRDLLNINSIKITPSFPSNRDIFSPHKSFGNFLNPNLTLTYQKQNQSNTTKSSKGFHDKSSKYTHQLHLQKPVNKMQKSKTQSSLFADNKIKDVRPFIQPQKIGQTHFLNTKQHTVIRDKQLLSPKGIHASFPNAFIPKINFQSQKNSSESQGDSGKGKEEFFPAVKSINGSQNSEKSENIEDKKNFLFIDSTNRQRTRSLNKVKSEKKIRENVPKFIQQKNKTNNKEFEIDIQKNHERAWINNEQEHPQNFQIKISIKPAIKKLTINNFVILRELGKGSFGKAVLAIEKNIGFVCVLKIIEKANLEQSDINQLIRQIKIQGFLQHKHLTALYGCFADYDNIYVVLELMQSGDLYNLMTHSTLTQPGIADYVFQICSGIDYMHRNYVLHRDIKPQNIFVSDKYLKLGDFGCSAYSDSNILRSSFVGSPCYLSPEQLRHDSYDDKVDMWEIGILTYELFFKESPFEKDIFRMMKEKRLNSNLSQLKFPFYVKISEEAKDFIQNALIKDSNERMSVSQALIHPFLKKSKERFQISQL